MATVASVLVVGVMMIVAGAAEVISAFQIKSWGKFLLWVLLGLLYVVAGFVTFENPLLAAVLLTLILGASLVASGIMRIILAFSMKRETPWIWVALSGVITLLLGVLILARWPVSSLYILGLFLGIDLIMAGAGWIGIGSGCAAPVEPQAADCAPRGLIEGGAPMRWIYLAVIILFAAATFVFALQNFEIVTMSFLGINARVPLALLVAVAYLLGAATGGSLFALLRRSYEGSKSVVGSP